MKWETLYFLHFPCKLLDSGCWSESLLLLSSLDLHSLSSPFLTWRREQIMNQSMNLQTLELVNSSIKGSHRIFCLFCCLVKLTTSWGITARNSPQTNSLSIGRVNKWQQKNRLSIYPIPVEHHLFYCIIKISLMIQVFYFFSVASKFDHWIRTNIEIYWSKKQILLILKREFFVMSYLFDLFCDTILFTIVNSPCLLDVVDLSDSIEAAFGYDGLGLLVVEGVKSILPIESHVLSLTFCQIVLGSKFHQTSKRFVTFGSQVQFVSIQIFISFILMTVIIL